MAKWLSKLGSRWSRSAQARGKASGRRSRSWTRGPLLLERLEDRLAPAVVFYTVTSNADNTDAVTHGGTGAMATPFQMSSLRGAILHANINDTSATIMVPAALGTR